MQNVQLDVLKHPPNFISFCGKVQEIRKGFWTPSMVFLEAYLNLFKERPLERPFIFWTT